MSTKPIFTALIPIMLMPVTDHLLDNPAFNALCLGNSHMANGTTQVKYFDKEVSPYAAFAENTDENFQILHNILPHNGPVLFVTPAEYAIPSNWKTLQFIPSLQMIHESEALEPLDSSITILPLTLDHVPQMVELTHLTKPGPFATRTIEFGHYQGIFDGDKLVAMAGQRLNPTPFGEVSAVCTHPDYLGRGYAKQLLLHQLHRIKAAGEIPFLHVRQDNERAIKVYQSIGFTTRIKVYFYVIMKQA